MVRIVVPVELFNRKGRVDVIGCDDGRRVLAVLMQNVSEVRRARRSTHDEDGCRIRRWLPPLKKAARRAATAAASPIFPQSAMHTCPPLHSSHLMPLSLAAATSAAAAASASLFGVVTSTVLVPDFSS